MQRPRRVQVTVFVVVAALVYLGGALAFHDWLWPLLGVVGYAFYPVQWVWRNSPQRAPIRIEQLPTTSDERRHADGSMESRSYV
jgi:hypothetical protein